MEMDLDAALNELGMLSSVTDSRRDYLKEQAARRRSACFHLVQLNPAYVTCLGPSRQLPKPVKPRAFSASDTQEGPRSLRASGSVPSTPSRHERRVDRHQRVKPRYSRPYHVPKRVSSPSSPTGRPRRTTEPSEESESSDLLKASIRLDADFLPGVQCLTRSKSVDDLSKQINPSDLVPNAAVRTQHQELELVSRHLKDLQMSSS